MNVEMLLNLVVFGGFAMMALVMVLTFVHLAYEAVAEMDFTPFKAVIRKIQDVKLAALL